MINKHILIVEDDRIIAKLIKVNLEKFGYKSLISVASGEKALEVIENRLPDLILMDIKLEGTLDGVTTANKINEKYDVPIIFLTAHSDKKTVDEAKFSQPYGYIVKPFNEKELQITIEMALYKHNQDIQTRMESDLFKSSFIKKDSNPE